MRPASPGFANPGRTYGEPDERSWHRETDALMQRGKGPAYADMRPIASGAFKTFYERSIDCPAIDGQLLRSSSSFNFMMVLRELHQQGHLFDEMSCLESKLQGKCCDTIYSKSIQGLCRDLECRDRRTSDVTIAKCLLLAFHSRLFDVNNERADGMTHTQGLCALMQVRGAANFVSGQARHLFRACRIVALYAASYQKQQKPCMLHSGPHGLWHHPVYSSIDKLTDILRIACDLVWNMDTIPHGTSLPQLRKDVEHCIQRLDSWYGAIRHRCGWEITEQSVARSRCPFQSFLIFNNPLAAEAYSICYTVLLMLSQLMDLSPDSWPHHRKLAIYLPLFDTLALATDIGRMTPYFIAGGVLGYYIIEFPARFALRCFTDAGERQNRAWLEAVMNRSPFC